MALTDVFIRNLRPGPKPKKHSDGGGLYIHVTTNGSKLWRMAYTFGGKQKLLSFGPYPYITLKAARNLREDTKEKLANGVDPQEFKKEAKLRGEKEAANSFEMIALEWHLKFRPTWTKSHGERIILRLQSDIFPHIGKKAITAITAPEVLRAIRQIEERGALETAHRTLQNCSKVFRYAIATGRADRDVTQDLRGALPPVKAKHHASITDPRKVEELLRAIDSYEGFFPTHCALKMAPLVFVRPGELRQAEWEEFDFENSLWRIPAGRMKMRDPHIVPLSRQVLEVLGELKPTTGDGRYLFPSIRSRTRPMSDNTINSALRRLGYSSCP